MQFEFDISNLITVLPELFILTMACVVLVLDLFLKESYRVVSYGLAQITLLLAIPLTLLVGGGATQVAFDGSYVRDAMGDLLKIGVYVVSIGAFLILFPPDDQGGNRD